MDRLTKLISPLFSEAKHSPERRDYHPERYLGHHIALVTMKAIWWTDDANLVMAALFHDVTKPEGTYIENGSYISNPRHAKTAAELIVHNDDVRYYVSQWGADWRKVAYIIRYHMDVKQMTASRIMSKHPGEMGKLLLTFRWLDDMVRRYEDREVFAYLGKGIGWHVRNIYPHDAFSFTVDHTRTKPERFPYLKLPDCLPEKWMGLFWLIFQLTVWKEE